jgi:hypothetical protein
MPPRKVSVHPALAIHEAREAAKAAAAKKAETSPHRLTAAELEFLPGKTVLDLGNRGLLRHLGLGLPIKPAPSPLPSASGPSGSAPAGLTDEALKKMSGDEISRAMSAGLVPGVGARRKGRRH